MDGLRQLVEAYVPYNEQEERDRELILEQIDSGRDILTRNNKNAHITVSGWVVSPDRKKVLMAYHNIYRSWAWLGGHADGDEDVRRVIKKEIQEESGLTEVKFLSWMSCFRWKSSPWMATKKEASMYPHICI